MNRIGGFVLGKTDQVTLYKRKGKIYSIIDHIIMGAAILFETYHSSPIRPIIRGRSDIRGIGLSAVSAMVFLLAWETTLSLNRHELVKVHGFLSPFLIENIVIVSSSGAGPRRALVRAA